MLAAVDHEVVDAVLDVRALVLLPREEPFVVGFVLGEEQRHVAVARQHERAQQRMRGGDRGGAGRPLDLLQVRLFGRPVRRGNPPRPVVAEPQRRQEVQVGRVRSAVGRGDLHQDVVGRALGVLDEHVEVPVVVEDAGIEQLVLHVVARALAVRPYKVAVGIGRLRVLVEIFHVRVGRRAIEVEVVLLHVLAVVALAVGQPEEPLLEDGILAVPQGQAEAEALLVVGDAGDAVFAPAVGAGAGVIVGEEVPGVARFAVVLAHRAPLAFAEIRPPLLPGGGSGAGFFQSSVFLRRHGLSCLRSIASPHPFSAP